MTILLAIAYWLVTIVLLGGVIGGLLVGQYYLLRESPDKKPDWMFGALLTVFALTLLHNLLIHRDVFEQHPRLLFLPVYFTLALGPLLFYFVKLKLFPAYRLRLTDAKHLIFPVGQLLYFAVCFFQPVEEKAALGRQFWSPFYGAMEMLLYIGTFWAYHYFAYRYVKSKKAVIKQHPDTREALQVWWLQRMVKALFILFLINAGYILTDFFAFEIFGLNLHHIKGFEYIGSLSFASMLGWLTFNGWVMRRA